MKLLIAIALCVVITSAVPIDTNSTEEKQNDLYSVNADSNAESEDRSKRFIFFKWFYPYPVYPSTVVKYTASPVKGKFESSGRFKFLSSFYCNRLLWIKASRLRILFPI